MHKYYTFLCCFLSLVRLAAQTTEFELENKYWNYRDRLIKDFVQIGDEPGQSITAAQLYDFWSAQPQDHPSRNSPILESQRIPKPCSAFDEQALRIKGNASCN